MPPTNKAVIPFLVGMMLLTGVCNTLLTKYQVWLLSPQNARAAHRSVGTHDKNWPTNKWLATLLCLNHIG